MLSELDILVYLKSGDDLDRTAARVFGALGGTYTRAHAEELGVEACEVSVLGFTASLYENAGDLLDPEFESYGYTLEIMSRFWCAELGAETLEEDLAEYYARFLAFELGIETATSILLETTDDAEIFEARAFIRNNLYRLDAGPTVPKAHVLERHEYEIPLGVEDGATL